MSSYFACRGDIILCLPLFAASNPSTLWVSNKVWSHLTHTSHTPPRYNRSFFTHPKTCSPGSGTSNTSLASQPSCHHYTPKALSADRQLCPRRGYINFYSLYIGWLCGAVFLHLPSFKALGFDIRTDVSMLLTIFLLSCLVSGFVLQPCLSCFFCEGPCRDLGTTCTLAPLLRIGFTFWALGVFMQGCVRLNN